MWSRVGFWGRRGRRRVGCQNLEEEVKGWNWIVQISIAYLNCGIRGLLASPCGLGRPVEVSRQLAHCEEHVTQKEHANQTYLLVHINDNIVSSIRHISSLFCFFLKNWYRVSRRSFRRRAARLPRLTSRVVVRDPCVSWPCWGVGGLYLIRSRHSSGSNGPRSLCIHLKIIMPSQRDHVALALLYITLL